MTERPGSATRPRGAQRRPLSTPLLLVAGLGVAYEAVLVFSSVLDHELFHAPSVTAAFDASLALMAAGIGSLCMERHGRRQDLGSAAIGAAMWLTVPVALARLAAPSDDPGVTSSLLVGLTGLAVAIGHGARPFALDERRRWVAAAGALVAGLLMALAVSASGAAPSALARWTAGVVTAALAAWAFWGARRLEGRDPLADSLLLAAAVWTIGLAGLLTADGQRDGIAWHLAGLSRPLGAALMFVGLLREQIGLLRDALARRRDLDDLHRAGQSLSRCLDPRDVAQAVAAAAVDVLGADGALLARLEGDGPVLRAVSAAGAIKADLLAGFEPLVGRGAWGLAVARRRPVWTSDLQRDQALADPDAFRVRLSEQGLTSVIAIPLVTGDGGALGAVALFYREARAFGDADVERLSAFGAQAALAVEHARAFERARFEARAAETLRDFGGRLLGATEAEPILQDAVRTTRELLGAECVGVFLLDAGSGSLRLQAGIGWRPGTVGTLALTPSSESFAGAGVVRGESVAVEDLAAEPPRLVPPHLAAHGVRASLEVPLGGPDRVTGVLAVYHQTPHRFGHAERGALTRLADQTARALEAIRVLADREAGLQRREDNHIQRLQAEKLEALGTLLSGIAHELNNPLSTIQLSVQLLKRKHTLPDSIRTRMDVVEEECERAARIIRELLVFARRKAPERKPIDVNEVVRGAVALQALEFEGRGIRVVTDLAPVAPLSGDAHQLQQVLLNLFSNALHALKNAPGGGRLIVRSREFDGHAVVEVEDSGPGIAPEHLRRVFDPFFTTRGVGEGSGLGLSVSIGIVEAHGGSMQAENVAGAGARFTVRLPIGERAETAEPASDARLPNLRHARILLIEDETSLRSVLIDVLTGLGHTVEEAATGELALRRLERGSYDLIALDLKLPDADGRTIWSWLGTHRPDLAPRVLFMTGDTMSTETQTFLQDSGRPVLNKPLAIAQIARMIDQVLGGA